MGPRRAWAAKSGVNDTTDRSFPHPDCRRQFWEPRTNSLILLSDGGAFMRTKPEAAGGQWRSLNGEYAPAGVEPL